MSLSPYSPYKTSQRAPRCFIGFSRRRRDFFFFFMVLLHIFHGWGKISPGFLPNGCRAMVEGLSVTTGQSASLINPDTKTQPALGPLFLGQERSYPKIPCPKPSGILTGDAEAEDVLVILKQFLYQGAFSCTRRAAQNHRPWSLHGWKDRKKKNPQSCLEKHRIKRRGTCGLPPTCSL